MYWMTARRSSIGTLCQVGIAVPRMPRVIVRIRSPSVGSGPLTRRNLNTASWKSRGRNLYMKVAAGPLPSPVTPWQPAQRRS